MNHAAEVASTDEVAAGSGERATTESVRPPLDLRGIPASVLLVDDRPANLTALEAVLDGLDLRLVRANSGEEALWRLLEEEFALILLDVQMPGLDGFAVASMIRERPATRALPIIFLTALSREASHILKGYQHGAVDYIVKPFDADVLRSKVSVFVELYKMSKLIERQAEVLRMKDRQEAERKGEHRFRNLTESVANCIWAARAGGEFHYANRSALSCCASLNFLDAVHPDDRARVEEAWAASLASRSLLELECRLHQADGTFRWHICRGVPEYDEAGILSGWIVSAADIQERKQVEEQLQLANEAKDAFLAAASHELRSPLSTVFGYVELAKRQLGDDAGSFQAKTFAVITRQVERMMRLVEDILDVGRIQHGRLSLEPTDFDLAELVGEVRDRLQFGATKHTLRSDVPDGLRLYADRDRLEQVVTNLISNAIRYSPEGGDVVIGAEATGDEVHVFVIDQGLGIPESRQREIFECYGRAHGARYGGLGLGLTICEGIVLQHGGRMWVESDGVPGNGSTFHVQLPRRLQSKASPSGT